MKMQYANNYLYSLNVQKREGDRLPEVVAVLASDLEVLVPFLLDHRVVLHRHRVPHEVFLQSQFLERVYLWLFHCDAN